MPPEPEARQLVIIRHGETEWNRQRRVMGDLDIPLTDEGRRQCTAAAEVLAQLGIERIVSSPLVRAAQSAEVIAEALRLDFETDAGLSEVRFGHWQGKTYSDVKHDRDFIEFFKDPASNPTPGGETIRDVQKRGLAAYERARPNERTLFVSHGDIIRSTLCHYLATPLAEFRRIRVDNCGMSGVVACGPLTEVKFVNALAEPPRAWIPVHWNKAT